MEDNEKEKEQFKNYKNLGDFPEEMLVYIFSFLNKSNVKATASACWRFSKIFKKPEVQTMIMKNSTQGYYTWKVELSDDKEHLYLHTRNFHDCSCIWGQLAGQALDRTSGRKPILYNIPEDTPESLLIDVESDSDQLILLLELLENEMKKYAIVPAGTTERIRKQIAKAIAKTAPQQELDLLDEEDAGDEKKFTIK